MKPTAPSALENSGALALLAVLLRSCLCKSGAAAYAYR
jgi:hypothetical protein